MTSSKIVRSNFSNDIICESSSMQSLEEFKFKMKDELHTIVTDGQDRKQYISLPGQDITNEIQEI